MILNDRTIRRLCLHGTEGQPERKLLSPFTERQVAHGMSYGLSAAGYDIRLAEQRYLGEANSEFSFQLVSSVEYFDMPDDVMGLVKDKSTWARQGVVVQNTVIEPGWRGFLTLELTNHAHRRAFHLQPGMPIAQVIFMYLNEPAEAVYRGKYQDQTAGVQPALFDDPCPRCGGTGAIDAPFSGSDPSCPECDGDGQAQGGGR